MRMLQCSCLPQWPFVPLLRDSRAQLYGCTPTPVQWSVFVKPASLVSVDKQGAVPWHGRGCHAAAQAVLLLVVVSSTV
jgi:hypothetical protein